MSVMLSLSSLEKRMESVFANKKAVISIRLEIEKSRKNDVA